MAKNKTLELPDTVNAEMLGLIMGITARRVQMLEKESVFKKRGRGKYVLAGAGEAYAKYLSKSEVDRREGTPVRELVDIERARKLKLENDQLENTLLPTQLALSAVDLIMGVLQSELAGLPAQASDDVAVRHKVEDGCTRVLKSVSERFEKAGEAMEAGRDPFDTSEADNA